MTDREKLIELLNQKQCAGYAQCYEGFEQFSNEEIADHLIANGVTVQKWIPVAERLPEPDKEVLLIVHGWKDRVYYTGYLHRVEAEKSWLTGIESKASDWTIYGFSYLREPVVTHWMPLPTPPEGG